MVKKISNEVITKIIKLREKGFSYPEISKQLNIPKTTVRRYAYRVKIKDEYLKQWTSKRGGSLSTKLRKEKKAYEKARKLINNLTSKEKILFISALYWAEGSKKDFGLSNTDPLLIKVFVTTLREVFEIKDEEFRVSIRIYEDLNKDDCLEFWSKVVNIPKENFVNVNVLRGKKVGKLQYGMCRVRITKGGELLKMIHAVNKTVAEKITVSL